MRLAGSAGGFYFVAFRGDQVLRGTSLKDADELQTGFVIAMERAGALGRRTSGWTVSDEPDHAEVLAELAALSRARQNDPQRSEIWPNSFIARMRECERLAGKTIYPEMAAMMRKLVRLWRELASGEYTAANDRWEILLGLQIPQRRWFAARSAPLFRVSFPATWRARNQVFFFICHLLADEFVPTLLAIEPSDPGMIPGSWLQMLDQNKTIRQDAHDVHFCGVPGVDQLPDLPRSHNGDFSRFPRHNKHVGNLYTDSTDRQEKCRHSLQNRYYRS
jgi:hypothetical protein